jgi:hypothetical protein
MPTYRSTSPEIFELSNMDQFGRVRYVQAKKLPDDFAWQLTLKHPDGQTWAGSYSGRAGILDAMSDMLNSHDIEFTQARENGDRPREIMSADRNRAVRDDNTFSAPHIVPRWNR